MGKSFLRDASAPLYLMMLGRPLSQMSRAEPGSSEAEVYHSLKEWPSVGFTGEKVAEAGLERGGVCPKGKLCVGRDKVCARGLSAPCRITCTVRGWQTVCVYSGACVTKVCESLTRPRSCCHCTPTALRGVGTRIECGCPPVAFERLCPELALPT
jgi:hypothetical protein